MKLEWQQDPPNKPMTWDEAMEYAKSIGGGWRLPSKEELKKAYDSKIEGFHYNRNYWSSSEYDISNAWKLYFYIGYVTFNHKSCNLYVRSVRDIKD